MSTDENTTRAEEWATTKEVLPNRGLRLLGTMGRSDETHALVLLGKDVLRVVSGDMAGDARILAIEPGRIVVHHQGREMSLRMSG